MEDPWANAWGDSSKSALPEPSTIWVAPSVSVLHGDHEDDLSTPSWPKESVSDWDSHVDHIWGRTEISSAWNPQSSTFDEISLKGTQSPRKTSHIETRHPDNLRDEVEAEEVEGWALPQTQLDRHTLPSGPTDSLGTSNVDDESNFAQISPPNAKPTSVQLPEDLDGFGSFETGEGKEEEETWNSTFPPLAGPADWGNAWSITSESESNDKEDVWETARTQKEKQDRHIPPELLSSILQQLDELSKDMWEAIPTSDVESNRTLDFEALGLESALKRLSPDDVTLPPFVPFLKTFTVKHMSDSLKLTRHFISTRSSPMAMYLASKGSNSWEAAIKANPVVSTDDITPVGWKVVESSVQEDSPVDEIKQKAGGIFSFFGRKAHSSTPSKSSTPRAGSPAIVEPSERLKIAPSNVISNLNDNSTTTSPIAAKEETPSEIAQPSAVSRFFGRIAARSKSQSIDSISLSAGDLEFLSDVPTISNINNPKEEDFGTLLNTPPPSSRSRAPVFRQESPLPKLPPPPSRPSRSRGSEDLLSLFDPAPMSTPPEPSHMMNPYSIPSLETTTKNHVSTSRISEETTKSSSSGYQDWINLQKAYSTQSPVLLSTNGRNGSPVPKSLTSSTIPVLKLPGPSPTTPPSKNTTDFDEEFSDFLFSPAVPTSQINTLPLEGFGSTSVSLPSIHTHDDDFGEFGEAEPPPPKPPLSAPIATRKPSKKADHSRTLSLLETAASRGRWLAPPSPIPEALPPPNRFVGTKLQTQQADALAALPALNSGYSIEKNADRNTGWHFPPPPSGSMLTPSVNPSILVPPTSHSQPGFVAESKSSAQRGGLSAQDLSFFEGL